MSEFGKITLAVMSMFGFRIIKTIDMIKKYKSMSAKRSQTTWLDDI